MNKENVLKKLPIGEQSIKKIIEENYIYIDKTEYIYNIITKNSYYFLSRPRRFGKSLLVSTFIEIFSGNKELFKDCWIYNSNYDWKKYPTIHLDFGTKKEEELESFSEKIFNQLKEISNLYNLNISEKGLFSYFEKLIKKLYENYGPVVFLVDEYDKPILDNINNLEKANYNREALRGLFGTAKGLSGMFRFQFITGITRFTKTSLFSDANHLKDISMSSDYNCLLGYTQNELEFYFKENINITIESENNHLENKNDLLFEIKKWYNGYLFSHMNSNLETVYNPFSILNFFSDKNFSNYWFETETPKFLIDLIRQNEYSIFENEKTLIPILDLNTFDIENIDFITLLFQTGYLTIKLYDKKTEAILLKYPNYEVEKSFTAKVTNIIDANLSKKIVSLVSNFTKYLNKNDIDGFIKEIQNLITGLVYFNHIKNEHYYLSMVVVIIKMIGIRSFSETATNYGRIDLMFEYLNNVYIFEFKLNKSALEALNQIKEKEYYKEYLNKGKTIYLIGINILFEKDKPRNINEWIFEKIV